MHRKIIVVLFLAVLVFACTKVIVVVDSDIKRKDDAGLIDIEINKPKGAK